MTPNLSQLFEGKEIRIIEQNNDFWFPLVDLATAWGLNPNTLYQLIARNGRKFRNRVSDVHVTCTPSEDELEYKSVNEQGFYVLLGAVNTDRLKNPAAAAAIDRFQYWVPELIQKYRKGQAIANLPADNPLAAALTRHADIADILIARYGYKPEIARKLAMQAVVTEQGENAIIYRGPALLPAPEPEALPVEPTGADPDFDKYFSLTKVAEFCKCTTDQARNILEKERVLDNSNGIWHLTRYGEGFGKVFIINPQYPHRLTERKTIRYNPEAVELVRKHMAAGQSELPLKSDAARPL